MHWPLLWKRVLVVHSATHCRTKNRSVPLWILHVCQTSIFDPLFPTFPNAKYSKTLPKKIDCDCIFSIIPTIQLSLMMAYPRNKCFGIQVFFYLYAGQVPYEPPLDIWRQDDQYDTVGGLGATKSAKTVEFATVAGLQKVLDGLDNVFVIRTAATDWKRFDSRAEAIQRRRERVFGTPYDPEQRVRKLFGLKWTFNQDIWRLMMPATASVAAGGAVPAKRATLAELQSVKPSKRLTLRNADGWTSAGCGRIQRLGRRGGYFQL